MRELHVTFVRLQPLARHPLTFVLLVWGLLFAALALRIRNGVQTYENLAQFDQTQSRWVATPIDLGPDTDQVFLVAFGTGLRNRSSLNAVTRSIGGSAATVSYLGAQGMLAGLDQANILLSRSLTGRGSVDLNLSVDGKTANTVSLTIK